MNRRQYLSAGGIAFAGFLGAIGGASATTGSAPDSIGGSGHRGQVSGGTGDQPTGQQSPIRTSYTGSGSAVVRGVEVELEGPTVFAMDEPGDDGLSLEVVDPEWSPVASIDNWSGVAVTDLDPGTYRLLIDAAGDWTVTVIQSPLYALEDVGTTFPVEIEGSSSEVYGPFDFSGPRTVSFSSSSDGRTVLSAQTATGETFYTPVSESGPVETTIAFDVVEDVVWLTVNVVSGEYEITISDE